MKKPVNLKAILIIASSVLLVLAIATAILWPVLWKGADWDSIHPTLVFGSDSDKHNGYADVTLYAIWGYPIMFDADGGKYADGSDEYLT